jgi:hypothetical protein
MEKVCRFSGERLTFEGFTGEIECPDPQHLCGIREFYGILGPTPAPTATDPGLLSTITAVEIIILSVASLFVVAVCSFGWRQRFRDRRVMFSREDEVEGSPRM